MTRPPLLARLIDQLRTSTGAKMFLILTLALLPLGVLALLASIQASRVADAEKAMLLKVAATQSARKLSAEINGDLISSRIMANTMASGVDVGDICGRRNVALLNRGGTHLRYLIYARDGRRLCGSPGLELAAADRFGSRPAELKPDRGYLVLRAISDDGRIAVLVLYDRIHLEEVTDPATALQDFRVSLTQNGHRFDIGGLLPNDPARKPSRISARVEPAGMTLTLTVLDPPPTVARALSLFLPLVMWFAAAGVGWLVVNQLLIAPLVALNRNVAAYRPGEVLEPLRRITTPAQEIKVLGETFRAITEKVATHEADMAEGLMRQRKLTREVHHRVKNNLQIIASLINLHARSAASAEASDAYGSIQRRVDALSVVHRNHYAEMEENRGLSLRALVSELSASLRGSAPENARGFNIQIKSENLFVSQDVAVPVAFLITELVELAMLVDPTATVRIAVSAAGETAAELSISSPALRTSEAMTELVAARFARVLTGLSRQLRAALDHDGASGTYSITIPANG